MDLGGPLYPYPYLFQPSQDNLLRYLTMKNSDPAFAQHHVAERPLYSPHAYLDFNQDFAAYNFGNELHFFTPLTGPSLNVDRPVANGTWKFDCAYEIRNSEGGVMAFRKLFSFCDTNDNPTGFVMYEFTLVRQHAWALCLVKRAKGPATTSFHSQSPFTVTYIPSALTLEKKQKAARKKRKRMAQADQ